VTNNSDGSVSVIDTATNTVVGSPIPVGLSPLGVAITPDGAHAYVTNNSDGSVSVIDTATNTAVGSPIPVGGHPFGLAITPDGTRAYVALQFGPAPTTVSVIDTTTNTVVGQIPVDFPTGVAITPDGTRAYVLPCCAIGFGNRPVSVIDTATNTVVAAIQLPPDAFNDTDQEGVAITSDGTRVYVVNDFSSVFVIDTATNTVVGSPIQVGSVPVWSGDHAYP
jgi:YVTN family beta-propeller protein